MITLATLPEATAQEVFDQVATHLLTQKKKSIENGACRYRVVDDGNTLMCAAGCLIGSHEYKESFERHNWDSLVSTSRVPKNHEILINRLQSIHDGNKPSMWYSRLKKLAETHDLQFNYPDESTVATES